MGSSISIKSMRGASVFSVRLPNPILVNRATSVIIRGCTSVRADQQPGQVGEINEKVHEKVHGKVNRIVNGKIIGNEQPMGNINYLGLRWAHNFFRLMN